MADTIETMSTVKEEDLSNICELLDKLYLDLFSLIEQYVQEKVRLEKEMARGEIHLAKARYIQGQNRISALQLPTEDGPEFEALKTVKRKQEELFPKKDLLELQVKNDATTDPLKWFGVLVPNDLRVAKDNFENAVSSVVNSANLQLKIHYMCLSIKKLKELKKYLVETSS